MIVLKLLEKNIGYNNILLCDLIVRALVFFEVMFFVLVLQKIKTHNIFKNHSFKNNNIIIIYFTYNNYYKIVNL